MGSAVRELLHFPVRPVVIEGQPVVDMSAELGRPKVEVLETTFEALTVNKRFLFEGHWWKKVEFIGSLKRFSRKTFAAEKLHGKYRGRIRNFRSSEVVTIQKGKQGELHEARDSKVE